MKDATKHRLRALLCVLSVLLTLLWLAFIFSNSLQNGEESGAQSGKVHKIVNEIAQNAGIEKPISEKAIRNTAHFGEFAVLSFLIGMDLWLLRLLQIGKDWQRSLLWGLLPIPACFLFACVDEWLQSFSPGRATQFTDVLLDSAGAATATVCFLLLFFIVRWIIIQKKSPTPNDQKESINQLAVK